MSGDLVVPSKQKQATYDQRGDKIMLSRRENKTASSPRPETATFIQTTIGLAGSLAAIGGFNSLAKVRG
jgi:hypothetical protein